mmetsp:Transcript_158372/g.507965  ORF Transcript_158372/g.507965 Transcript_158372/m.507965 type:complete len:576 (-) Transcript_158372:127-1854(-)
MTSQSRLGALLVLLLVALPRAAELAAVGEGPPEGAVVEVAPWQEDYEWLGESSRPALHRPRLRAGGLLGVAKAAAEEEATPTGLRRAAQAPTRPTAVGRRLSSSAIDPAIDWWEKAYQKIYADLDALPFFDLVMVLTGASIVALVFLTILVFCVCRCCMCCCRCCKRWWRCCRRTVCCRCRGGKRSKVSPEEVVAERSAGNTKEGEPPPPPPRPEASAPEAEAEAPALPPKAALVDVSEAEAETGGLREAAAAGTSAGCEEAPEPPPLPCAAAPSVAIDEEELAPKALFSASGNELAPHTKAPFPDVEEAEAEHLKKVTAPTSASGDAAPPLLERPPPTAPEDGRAEAADFKTVVAAEAPPRLERPPSVRPEDLAAQAQDLRTVAVAEDATCDEAPLELARPPSVAVDDLGAEVADLRKVAAAVAEESEEEAFQKQEQLPQDACGTESEYSESAGQWFSSEDADASTPREGPPEPNEVAPVAPEGQTHAVVEVEDSVSRPCSPASPIASSPSARPHTSGVRHVRWTSPPRRAATPTSPGAVAPASPSTAPHVERVPEFMDFPDVPLDECVEEEFC